MTQEEVGQTIINEIKEQHRIDLSEDAVITDHLDSLDIMESIMTIEELFEVEIPDEDIDSMEKISDLITYVHEKVEK